MSVTRPNVEQIIEIGEDLGMSLTYAVAEEYLGLMQGNFDAYDVVDAEPDFMPPVTYPRTTGHTPELADNPFGAWARRVEVKGAAEGKLKGKTIALKDNVALAGVPMANGASTLAGFIPAKPCANTSACRAAATRLSPAWCITRTRGAIRRADLLRGPARSSAVASSIWPSVAIRADRSECLRPSAASPA
jgi:amidase